MLPIDAVLFGVTFFFALIMLFQWKRRRVINARRVNRGLRGYVSGKPATAKSENTEDLMVA